jgi:glycosyltransferase involved in cell wall biosynthesis
MKIIFVNNARLASGAEEHLLDLAQAFEKLRVEMVFFVRENGVLKQKLTERGYKAYPVFNENNISLPFRIARLLRDENADVISVNREHNMLPVYFAAKIAAPFLSNRPRLVNVFHTPTGRWYPYLGGFDALIATSEYTAQSFYRLNRGMERKTSIIHYGIEMPQVDVAAKRDNNRPRRFFRDRGFPIIGMVGELWKNQEELIDAAPFMLRQFPEITIALVGGGDDSTFAALRKKIAERGLEKNFVLTGRIDRKLIPDIFFDLDISVSTHRNEGFGIVHIESLGCCTPVVAYNDGGIVEILKNGGGVLVDGQTEDFAKSVLDLLTDDDKRASLGIEGRKVVEDKFLLDVMGRNHFEFYQNLLAAHQT